MLFLPQLVGMRHDIGDFRYICMGHNAVAVSLCCNGINEKITMRTVQLGTHTVEIYDSIEQLPMRRFHKYNKMLLIDAGIGSDLADFDNHLAKIGAYLKSEHPELAQTELENMRQNVYFIQSGVSPRHLSFAALVASIDGTRCDDLSDEALQAVVDRLADVPISDIAAEVSAVKKKIDDELQQFFPRLFDDATIKEYFDILKRRVLAQLDCIINGSDEIKQSSIERLTLELLLYNKPRAFAGEENMEVAYDKQFENMCIMMSQHLNVDAKGYTVMEYYNAYEYIREQFRKQKTAKK